MGISICLLVKAVSAARDLETNTVFIAEMSKNIFPGQRITAESILSDFPNIKKGSVELITARSALEMMKRDMPELAYMADNPFHDVLVFKTVGLHKADVEDLKQKILEINGIDAVYRDEEFLATLTSSTYHARLGLFSISVIMLLCSIIALGLRVRRDLRQFKGDIRIMSLAGAEGKEIISNRKQWSVKWAMISVLFASAILALNIIFINYTLLDGLEITLLQAVIAIVAMSVIVVLVHLVYTHRSISKYLEQLSPIIRK